MDNNFYENIISLLIRSDIKFRTTEIRQVKYQQEETTVYMSYSENISLGPTPLSQTPVISCLIVFALFDAYLENKYSMNLGMSFRQKYIGLPSVTNQNIIEKECYRLMKTIRNGFVHNINSIISGNDTFHFNYGSPQRTLFNLDISSDKLNLLYSIILLLVKGKYEIETVGHFINVICTHYSELKDYVDRNGNFTDDGDMGIGSANSFTLMPISSHLYFNTAVRYPVLNSTYEIIEDRIYISSIFYPGFEGYSADYCITNNEKEYVIPQEILDTNNSLSLSDLSIWEYTR